MFDTSAEGMEHGAQGGLFLALGQGRAEPAKLFILCSMNQSSRVRRVLQKAQPLVLQLDVSGDLAVSGDSAAGAAGAAA